jgi:DNA invertase Pin-like site-specific DNA recombinase
MTNPIPRNIIELLRVSTDLQDVARQRTDLERLKKRFNLNAVWTLELHGVSGTATLDNKQVQHVLNDLGRSDVHGIGLSSLDRLFRPGKRYGQFAILDRFVDEGKIIWSLREGEIDPATDEGYDKCISAGGRAGAEWRELRRRTRDGRRETLEKGKLDCGKARYGYVYINKHHPDPERRQTYELDPVEAFPGLSKQQVICDVFAWRRAGTKIYTIAKRLNEGGVLSPGYRGHPPGSWSREAVRKLLKSRTYTGEHIRSGISVPCPRIIDDETFALVQERMDESRRQHVGRPSSLYLLRSYVWCGKCQHRCVTHRTTHGGKVYGQYRCGNYDNKPPHTRHCHAPGIGQPLLETAAWTMIWQVLTNPVVLLEMGQAYYDSLPQPESERMKELERELARLRDREDVVLELMKRKLVKITDGQKEIEQVSFIKSRYRPGLPVGDPRGARDHDDAGPVHRPPPGMQHPPQPQREGRSGRQSRDFLRSASTLPLPKCTGDGDLRFSPLPGACELHQAAIRPAERPASPYSVRYEFGRRDNSEHIRG